MTNEERDLISQFIRRIGGAPAAQSGSGSVPATVAAPLPPVDREADALIAELFTRYPEARYRLTQTAFVQEFALTEAQNTINQLQWQLDQARQQQAPAAPAQSPWGAAVQQSQPSRGLFGGLFGANREAPPPAQPHYQQPPPQPQQAPGYQPGMFQQRGGSGFLASALTTAAGVAGGMVVGNMLMNAFSGQGSAHAAAPPVTDPGGSGWANATSAPDPYAAGGAPKEGGWNEASPVNNQDQGDSGWSDAGSDDEF